MHSFEYHCGINTCMILFILGILNHFYLGFFANFARRYNYDVSVLLSTNEVHPVTYFIEAPGVGFYHKGNVSAGNEVILNFPDSVEVSSYNDQNKGIHLTTSNGTVTVIGQYLGRGSSDTYFALSITALDDVYVYYGISVPRASHLALLYSLILIVGTEDNTMISLTTTQPVNISTGNAIMQLIPGRQFSFRINRLQTIYIGSLDDLSGTKIVTDKPVSVLSGHECANVPWNIRACSYLIEQIPPTALWGTMYYTVPLAGKASYTVKVLAAHDSTTVNVYCNNTMRSFTINEGRFFNVTVQIKEYCAIYSNKKILVVQLSHGLYYDISSYGDPMMTLVPATNQYLNNFDIVTIHGTRSTFNYDHYVNIVVMAQYYQPNMIFLIAGGVNISLATHQWIPIQVNSITEAYAAQLNITEGIAHIVHTNAVAQMMTIVYGFYRNDGYGHIGGTFNPTKRIRISAAAG